MLLELGCLLYRVRGLVLGAWAIGLLVALPVAPHVFRTLTAGGFSSPDLEAFRASTLLDQRFGSNPSNLYLVYTDPSGALPASDPRFLQQIEDSLGDLGTLDLIQGAITPSQSPRQIAPDGQAAYASITLQ